MHCLSAKKAVEQRRRFRAVTASVLRGVCVTFIAYTAAVAASTMPLYIRCSYREG